MPHGANGSELKVGDIVLIEAVVESIQAQVDFCNCNVRTTIPMPPYTEGMVIVINTRQAVKKQTA